MTIINNLKKINSCLDENIKDLQIYLNRLNTTYLPIKILLSNKELNFNGQKIKIDSSEIDLSKLEENKIHTLNLGKIITCKDMDYHMDSNETIYFEFEFKILNTETGNFKNISFSVPFTINNNIYGYGAYKSFICHTNEDIVPIDISKIRNIKNDDPLLNKKIVNFVNYWRTIDDINLYKEMMYSSLINYNFFPLIDKKLDYSGIFFIDEPKYNLVIPDTKYLLQLTFDNIEVYSDTYVKVCKNFTCSIRIIDSCLDLTNEKKYNILCNQKFLNNLEQNKIFLYDIFKENCTIPNNDEVYSLFEKFKSSNIL